MPPVPRMFRLPDPALRRPHRTVMLHGLRRLANLVNLSTPAGLALARLTGCTVRPGPGGILLAEGYPLAVPAAAAFTVGNVVLFRAGSARRIEATDSPLLRHEMRHSSQYAVLGPFFLPLYFAAAACSRLLTGNPASVNPFERLAGLRDGGYREASSHPVRIRRG